MWPWRRRRSSVQRSTADSAPAAAPATPSPPVARPASTVPPPPPAWRSLPPIQRTLADAPLLNQPGGFSDSLAAWHDPSFLKPLGHAVGSGEPAGLLHEVAVPAPPAPTDNAGGTAGEHVEPPLAIPPSSSGAVRPQPAVQRHAAGLPPPVAVASAVPTEPLTVSRLTVAPAPPVTLTLPAMPEPVPRPAPDPPVSQQPDSLSSVPTPAWSGSAESPEPEGQSFHESAPDAAPEPPAEATAPTLGVPDSTGPYLAESGSADAPGSVGPASDTPPSPLTVSRAVPDSAVPTTNATGQTRHPVSPEAPAEIAMPVQRAAPEATRGVTGGSSGPTAQRSTAPTFADAPRPVRRLGLGEPIIPPALPLTVQTSPAAQPSPTVPPRSVDPPSGVPSSLPESATPTPAPTPTEPTPADPGNSSPLASADPEPAGSSSGSIPVPEADGDTADLLGSEISLSRLVESTISSPDQRASEPVQVGTSDELPLTGGPALPGSAQPDGSPYDQPDVSWGDSSGFRSAPTLGDADLPGVFSVTSPTETVTRDGPSVQRSAESGAVDLPLGATAAGNTTASGGATTPLGPTTTAERGRSTGTVAAGGARSVDAVTGGAPAGSVTWTPPPLVVARLIGDRPIELLPHDERNGPSRHLPDPLPPTVQRVQWDRTDTSDSVIAPAEGFDPPSHAGSPQAGPGHTSSGFDLPAQPVSRVDPLPGHGTGFPSPRGSQSDPAGGVLLQRSSVTGSVRPPVDPPSAALPVNRSVPNTTPSLAGPFPTSTPLVVLRESSAGPGGATLAPVVQRLDEPTTAPDPPPAGPPDPPVVPEPEPEPAPTVSGPTQPPAPGGQATSAAGAAGMEPEELLKKLFDPLLRRLKTELRLDRERHGVLDGPD
ncbi:hypothetical protein GCM10027290_63290 [Micromonospora sonneratiae]|uniref:Syndecan 1 n=1 Tax=Micromonospora sonneratiae TaxID=1184706 RepID=A0ABW3YIQ6_9ACTN